MANLSETSSERRQQIAQELRHASRLDDLGNRIYNPMLISVLCFCALVMVFGDAVPWLDKIMAGPSKHTPTGGLFFVWLCLTLAAAIIGTPVGVWLSRRKLRHLYTELTHEGVPVRDIMNMMQHNKDKEVRKAAAQCLRIIEKNGAGLGAAETLVRGSSVPTPPEISTLLRPTIEAGETEPEQLLRAASGSSDHGE